MLTHPFQTIAFIILMAGSSLLAADYHASPTGDDSAAGNLEAPFLTISRALEEVRNDASAAGSTVWLADGTYVQNTTILLEETLSGSPGKNFVLRASNPGKALISGGISIDSEKFKPVSDESRTALIQESARPHIQSAALAGTAAAIELARAGSITQLVSKGWLLNEARWPDKGYAHIHKILDGGAVWTEGRTLTPRPKFSVEEPIGGAFTLHETWHGDWQKEIEAAISKPKLEGYLRYDWLTEASLLASAKDGALKLAGYSRYGVGQGEKIPRRIFVTGLLSELDRPGEWFWDDAMKTLYLWPVSAGAPVVVGGNFDLFEIRNASHITLRGIALEHAKGGVVVNGGQDITIAGCQISLLSGTGVSINGGTRHRIQSCDIHEVNMPLSVIGTAPENYTWNLKSEPPKLVSDAHLVTNNHIWNCQSFRGVKLSGVGIVFSHNLIHDLRGGAVLWSGNDFLFEDNEFYSLLKEMGDWGVTDSGASWFSYGNVLRHNFVHHIIGLPQAHPVNGFYFDNTDAGDLTTGNVFYKAGNRTVLLNGGAAQRVENNLFISNYINVYQTGGYAEKNRAQRPLFDSGKLKRGDVTDFWWRTEQVTGKDGWASPQWSAAYPDFKRAMELDPYSPVLNRISRNLSLGELKETISLNKVPAGMVEAEAMGAISNEAFVDPSSLDFAFKPDFKLPAGFEPIPFQDIGLLKDEFRTEVPDKASYRRAVRERNATRLSYDPDAKYDWKTANDLYYDDPPYWKSGTP